MSAMRKVQIIGAGQLGSRHLQSLKSLKEPLSISVVDPNEASLQVARERYDGIGGENHPVSYGAEIRAAESPWDLVIVATNSNVRREIIQKLLSTSKVKNLILEKILFSSPEDYEAVDQMLRESRTRAWVNCCMRQMPIYRKIRDTVSGSRIHLDISGSQFGLITNAIHYFDYLAFLTGETHIRVETLGLDREVIPSKRKGFLEMNGVLTGYTANGSSSRLTCFPSGNLPLIVQIHAPTHRFIVRESEGKAWATSEAEGWKWSEIEAKIPFQSKMTAELAQEIFSNGECSLTTLGESIEIHRSLLNPLREHLAKSGIKTDLAYPFT